MSKKSIITFVNVSAIDLNLLPVLDAVLREANATRAANRLGLTQPAVSNALARLRRVFGDPLVVKSRRGLVPTPRALELRDELSRALQGLEASLQPKRAFSLATTRRTWTLSFADHYGRIVLPKLMSWVSANAPLATVRVMPLERMIASDALAAGPVDVYVGIPGAPMHGCHTRHFFDDELVCVSRAGAVKTMQQFLARQHVSVEISPGRGKEVDEALWALQHTRRVALTVTSYSMALEVAAGSDLVAVVPARLADGSGHRLRVTPLPFSLPALSVSMFWHRRVHADESVKALRRALLELR